MTNESDKEGQKNDKNDDDDEEEEDDSTDFITIRYADKYAEQPSIDRCWHCQCGEIFQSYPEYLQHFRNVH